VEISDKIPGHGTIGFITIGCRSNQADTAGMISSLQGKFRKVDVFSADQLCDFIVVNTCTVTSRAEVDARKLLRRAKRLHPDAVVIVTGCAVQVDCAKWLEMPEVDHVIGIADRDRLLEIFESEKFSGISAITMPSGGVFGETPVAGHRSRPFLKIQDGCTRGCAYCIVPKARGPERSRPLEFIERDLRKLSELGYREIVLTGIHLGRWGTDIGLGFSDLLDLIDKLEIESRIRLSSLEPMDLSPDLVAKILSTNKICPHIHIPLQSGDQAILDSMGRGHTIQEYISLIETAKIISPDSAIGTDLIVGFPGENDKTHQNTLDLIKSLPFSYLHIFSWSPRAGARASGFPNKPKGEDVRSRMRSLKALDKSKREAFTKSQDGKIRDFLIETPENPKSPVTALSDNYIRIAIKDSVLQSCIGNIVPIRIDIKNALIRE